MREAEGYTELGLWEEAWYTLGALSYDERSGPPALRLKLLCCAQLARWDEGNVLACAVILEGDPGMNAALGFYRELAKCSPEQARASIAATLKRLGDANNALCPNTLIAQIFDEARTSSIDDGRQDSVSERDIT